MVYTYLLKSHKDGSYYVGISKDPEFRLKEHNNGDKAATSLRLPWKLVYKKSHDSYEDARKHEKWLKKKNKQYCKSWKRIVRNS